MFIVEEEATSYLLPENFMGNSRHETWQDRTVMGIWFVLLIGYALSLAPIAFTSLFFWVLVVEWSLDSTLHFSMESFDHEAEEEDQIEHSKYFELFDRLQHGFVKCTPDSLYDQNDGAKNINKTESSKQHETPPLTKVEWNQNNRKWE